MRSSAERSRHSSQVGEDLGLKSPRPALGTSAKTGKRVRFIDESFAQELITREKARLELKIQQLRNLHIFAPPEAPASEEAPAPEGILKSKGDDTSDTKTDKKGKKTVKHSEGREKNKQNDGQKKEGNDKRRENGHKKDRKNERSHKKDSGHKSDKDKSKKENGQNRDKKKDTRKKKSTAAAADEKVTEKKSILKGKGKELDIPAILVKDDDANVNETKNDIKVDETNGGLQTVEVGQNDAEPKEQVEVQADGLEDANNKEESNNEEETTQSKTYGDLVVNKTKDKKRSGVNIQKLNKLATPKSRTNFLNTARRRRLFMANASPDHLKLTVPERIPRTIPQLKNLHPDEIDYMVQPKSIREFQLLTLMRLPPHIQPVDYIKRDGFKKTLYASPSPSNKRQSQRAKTAQTPRYPKKDSRGTASKNIAKRPSTGIHGRKPVKTNNPDNGSQTRKPPLTTNNADGDKDKKPVPSKKKTSFKFAAMGVMSMVSGDREKLNPDGKKTTTVADIAMKAFLPTHKRAPAAPAKSEEKIAPPTTMIRASEIPGDRTLRLRPPRQPAWEDELEQRAKDDDEELEYLDAFDDASTMYSTRSSIYSTRSSRSSRSNWSTLSKKSAWGQIFRRRKTAAMEELTKDLDKCTYLRGVDDHLLPDDDITAIFADLPSDFNKVEIDN